MEDHTFTGGTRKGETVQILDADEAYQKGREAKASANPRDFLDRHSNDFARSNHFQHREHFDRGYSDQARDDKGRFEAS